MIRALIVAAVVLAAAANAGVAAEKYPIFDATDVAHRLAHVNGISFDVRNLELEVAPASIVVTTPGYTFADIDPNEFIIIAAKPAGGGHEQRIIATLGAPTAVSVCVPGTHDLTWNAQAGNLSLPVAVDREAVFTRLIVCLDAVQAEGLRITEVAFSASFHAPAKAGMYRFSAVVAPSTGPEYELRALVELPMRLTSKASYSTETQTLTVSGRLLAVNKPASGRTVMVSTGAYILGNVMTRSDGTYVLTRKTTQPPPTVSNYVYPLYGACAPDSTAPGGCKSESLDSIQNNDIKVARRGRVRA